MQILQIVRQIFRRELRTYVNAIYCCCHVLQNVWKNFSAGVSKCIWVVKRGDFTTNFEFSNFKLDHKTRL
jgi:hypothetical protein